MSEATVPAEQPAAGQAPRVPAPDVDPGRSSHHQGTSGQGPRPPVSLIWRVSDRATFRALQRAPRARRGLLSVSWSRDDVEDVCGHADDASGDACGSPSGGSGASGGSRGRSPARVAFAVSRKVGPAVTRNRVRRRLRELARRSPLAGGAWLVGVAPGGGDATFAVLAQWWEEAVTALGGWRA